MWGLITTIFLVFYCVICFYVGRRGWTTVNKTTTYVYKRIYWVIFGILILSFPLAEFVKDYLSETGRFWFTLWSWYSMLAVVYIFLLILFIDVLLLMDKRLNFVPTNIKEHRRAPIAIFSLIVISVTLVLIYGTWNVQNTIVTNYEVNVNKKAGSIEKIRIAMVADVHYGEIIDGKPLDKMVEIMKELKPDIILIAGDIIEGTPNQDDENILLEAFKQMDPKYGKVAVPGNHDRWLRSEEGRQSFQDAGITLLRDEVLKIEDSFYIIGRDDPGHGSRERKELDELMKEVDSLLPVILLDHQPSDLLNAQKSNIDIQLSGHTHMGQIFPANFITGQLYELDWGILTKESYNLIVTNGYWYVGASFKNW